MFIYYFKLLNNYATFFDHTGLAMPLPAVDAAISFATHGTQKTLGPLVLSGVNFPNIFSSKIHATVLAGITLARMNTDLVNRFEKNIWKCGSTEDAVIVSDRLSGLKRCQFYNLVKLVSLLISPHFKQVL